MPCTSPSAKNMITGAPGATPPLAAPDEWLDTRWFAPYLHRRRIEAQRQGSTALRARRISREQHRPSVAQWCGDVRSVLMLSREGVADNPQTADFAPNSGTISFP